MKNVVDRSRQSATAEGGLGQMDDRPLTCELTQGSEQLGFQVHGS